MLYASIHTTATGNDLSKTRKEDIDKGVNLLFFSTLSGTELNFKWKLRRRDLPLYHLQIQLRNVLTRRTLIILTHPCHADTAIGVLFEIMWKKFLMMFILW